MADKLSHGGAKRLAAAALRLQRSAAHKHTAVRQQSADICAAGGWASRLGLNPKASGAAGSVVTGGGL